MSRLSAPQILEELGGMGLYFKAGERGRLIHTFKPSGPVDNGKLTDLLLLLNIHRQEALDYLRREDSHVNS